MYSTGSMMHETHGPIVDRIQRVTTVIVETVDIVNGLPDLGLPVG